jgi:hypothetical protein
MLLSLSIGFPVGEGTASQETGINPVLMFNDDLETNCVNSTTSSSHLIPWLGGEWFLSGVNIPWRAPFDINGDGTTDGDGYGADFGTVEEWNVPDGWNAFDYDYFDRIFQDLEDHGVNTIRWWVFADGRGAPEFSSEGTVTGLDDQFYLIWQMR